MFELIFSTLCVSLDSLSNIFYHIPFFPPLSLRLSLCLSLSASLSLFVNMTQWLVALVVVSLALCGSVVSAFYEGKSPVVSLSGATFDSAIFGSEVILP